MITYIKFVFAKKKTVSVTQNPMRHSIKEFGNSLTHYGVFTLAVSGTRTGTRTRTKTNGLYVFKKNLSHCT